MKFLDSCSANGLPPEDLFLPDDLMEGTLHGLERVAVTIIALVKWAETSAPTCSRSLPDGANVNPAMPPSLRKRPRITAGAVDPLLVQPLGPTHVAVGELPSLGRPLAPRRLPTFDLPPDTAGAEVPPRSPQSTPPSAGDQSMSSSTKSKSEKELFTTNQSTPPSTKLISPLSKEIYPSAMDQSTTNESLANQSRSSTGSRLSQLTNHQSGESSPGSMLSSLMRVRLLSLPTTTVTRLLSGFLPSRTRLLSLPTRPRLSSFPTRTRRLSSPTRARLLSLPTRTRLLSLQTRTRLLSLPIRTQFTPSPCERINISKDEIFPPTTNTLIIPALEKQGAITTPRTEESLALKNYDAPDHLDTLEHAFVDTTLGKSFSSWSWCVLTYYGALYLALSRQTSESSIRELDGKGAVIFIFIFLSLCLYFVIYVH